MIDFQMSGRLATDPSYHESASGPYAKLFVASPRKNRPDHVDFVNVVVFGDIARKLADQNAAKGDPITIGGECRQNVYTDNAGDEQRRVEFIGRDVIHQHRASADDSRERYAEQSRSDENTHARV